MKKLSTYEMALIGVLTAVICILGPLAINIPISPVPISLANLAIYFAIYILGCKLGTISVLIYLLIGLIGIPVFSNFSGGFAKIAGPTGGYLVGYIFLAILAGWMIDHFKAITVHFLALILGTVILYAFGTAWLAHQAGLTFVQAMFAGVIPFIPGDLIKIIITLILGPIIKKRLKGSGLI